MAGTTDITNDFDSKTELDFRNRLVAKFVIPSSKSFWEGKFNAIGEGELFPKQGTVFDLCSTLKEELRYELQPGHSGEFLNFWVSLESYVVDAARRQTARNLSVREATLMLSQRGLIPAAAASEIDAIQKVRNDVVHRPKAIDATRLSAWLERLRELLRVLGV